MAARASVCSSVKRGIPQRLGQPKGVRRAPRFLPLSSRLGRSRQGGCAPTPRLSNALPAATRKSAFVHAIASAGVAFAVTRSCAEGTSTICGCDSHHKGPPGEGWKWGGCSEDADFGVLVSREFADARENRPDARSAMNKHNNEAGRTVSRDRPRRTPPPSTYPSDPGPGPPGWPRPALPFWWPSCCPDPCSPPSPGLCLAPTHTPQSPLPFPFLPGLFPVCACPGVRQLWRRYPPADRCSWAAWAGLWTPLGLALNSASTASSACLT